jgi:hypothetical protein
MLYLILIKNIYMHDFNIIINKIDYLFFYYSLITMDSLHIFTIPKWLPKNIPHELWTIIFCWKWRLEMKDIHKELFEQMKIIDYCTREWPYDRDTDQWYTKGIKGNLDDWFILVRAKDTPRISQCSLI